MALPDHKIRLETQLTSGVMPQEIFFAASGMRFRLVPGVTFDRFQSMPLSFQYFRF